MFWLFRHCRFLSTLSLRRATVLVWCSFGGASDFYPRSPCGERHKTQSSASSLSSFLSTLSLRRATSAPRFTPTASRNFYPRSPCGERHVVSSAGTMGKSFLSTLSLRRATHAKTQINPANQTFLSTLSLRRATTRSVSFRAYTTNFYPRSPCGERRSAGCSCRSVRPISIHALLAESDPGKVNVVEPGLAFLSTLSLRRAT